MGAGRLAERRDSDHWHWARFSCHTPALIPNGVGRGDSGPHRLVSLALKTPQGGNADPLPCGTG